MFRLSLLLLLWAVLFSLGNCLIPSLRRYNRQSTSLGYTTLGEDSLAALQVQPLDSATAVASLKDIGDLCRLDKENAVALHKLDVCEVVVKVLAEDAVVATQRCYAIHSLAKGGNDIIDKLMSVGADKSVIEVMRAFPSDSEVARHGCMAIINLATGSSFGDNGRRDKLAGAGAIEEVIKVLRAYPEDEETVKYGCMAMVNLAFGSNDIRDKLVVAGAIDEVIKPLRAFPKNAEVAKFGLMALGNLAKHSDTIRDKLVGAGAIEEVMTTFRSFDTNADVIEQGCVTIYNLTLGSNDRNKKLLAAGVKPLLEAVLNNDALTQAARDEAKDALSNLM